MKETVVYEFLSESGTSWSGWAGDERSEEAGGICFTSQRERVFMCNAHVFVNVCSFKDIQTLH